MKSKATKNVVLSTFILIIVFAIFVTHTLYYLQDLNSYFAILSKNTDMITAVNNSRAANNQNFLYQEAIIACFGAIAALLEIKQVSKLVNLYRSLAYEDVLTHVYSRAALENKFDEIEKHKSAHDITYFLFDMNYLKQINDGYGHKYGDDFLIGMATCLENAFKNEANVYRLGGDEFVATYFNRDRSPEYFLDAIDREVDNWNKTKNKVSVELSFAKGYFRGTWDYADDFFRETLYEQADNMMYEEKEAFHRIHPKSERIDRITKEVKVRRLGE